MEGCVGVGAAFFYQIPTPPHEVGPLAVLAKLSLPLKLASGPLLVELAGANFTGAGGIKTGKRGIIKDWR
jgi:hypothetical protein